MSKILELGYLGFEVSDLVQWESYAANVLGLGVVRGPNEVDGKETRLLRMDKENYRFILTQGSADDCIYCGWKVTNKEAVESFSQHLNSLNHAWQWATDEELTLRNIDKMLHFSDPDGNRHEVYCAPVATEAAFSSDVVNSGFVTGDGGLGHIVFEVENYPGVVEFAETVLGFNLSDHIYMAVEPEVKIEISFFHTNERHHSFAVAPRAPGPGAIKSVHHFMLETAVVSDVGLARDRYLAAGLPVVMDIGQHPNDKMISFYGLTPSGFCVEFGCGGVIVDEDHWSTTSYEGISEWGHQPIAPINQVQQGDPS